MDPQGPARNRAQPARCARLDNGSAESRRHHPQRRGRGGGWRDHPRAPQRAPFARGGQGQLRCERAHADRPRVGHAVGHRRGQALGRLVRGARRSRRHLAVGLRPHPARVRRRGRRGPGGAPPRAGAMRCAPAPSGQRTDRQLQRISRRRRAALRGDAAALPTLSRMPNATLALDRASADIALSRAAREDLERAANEATGRGADESNPVDVLRAVLSNRGSLAVNTLRGLGADPAAVAAAIPADAGATPLPLRQLLVNANREAQVLGHYSVDSIHLLLALLYSDSPATSAPLQKAGLTLYDLRRHLQTGSHAAVPTHRDTSRPDAALRRRPWPSLR